MHLDQLREANQRRNQQSYKSCDNWTASDWGCAVSGEVGELCNLIKKIRRGDNIPPGAIMKEIGDIAIYLDLAADHLGLSLSKCIQYAFEETSKKIGSTVVIPAMSDHEYKLINCERLLRDHVAYLESNELEDDFEEFREYDNR